MLDVNTSQQLAFGEAGKEQIQMIGPAVFSHRSVFTHLSGGRVLDHVSAAGFSSNSSALLLSNIF